MKDNIKCKQVYEVLLMPINCEKHCGFESNRKVNISKQRIILYPQKHIGHNTRIKLLERNLDIHLNPTVICQTLLVVFMK